MVAITGNVAVELLGAGQLPGGVDITGITMPVTKHISRSNGWRI